MVQAVTESYFAFNVSGGLRSGKSRDVGFDVFEMRIGCSKKIVSILKNGITYGDMRTCGRGCMWRMETLLNDFI